MVKFFFTLSCLLAAVLLAGILYLRKNHHVMRRSIQNLFAMAAVTILCNAIAVLTRSESISALAHGLYYAATDWLVITLLIYAEKYTGLCEDRKSVNMIVCIGAGIDTCSMIWNVFSHHVFRCERMAVKGGGTCYVPVPNRPMYTFHLLFVYAMGIFVLLVLLIKTSRTIKLYHKKYTVVIWSYVCILAVNIGYRFIEGLSIDLSPIFYMGLALAIGYFTLFYVPKGIVAKLLAFSVEDMESGILCFDMEGKCVYANNEIKAIFQSGDDVTVMERFFKEWKGERADSELTECIWQEKQEAEGEIVYYEERFKPLLDVKGNYIGGFFSMEDRTEELKKLEWERFRATHDPLTGIFNRQHFFEMVRERIDEEPQRERYMICSDIKDFKMVNVLFGKEMGDEILKRAAAIIRKEASVGTVFGRLNADRFALCMNVDDYKEEIFTNYVAQLSEMAKSSVYRMHIHIGVYRITDPAMEVSGMCDRALMAVDSIKDNYRQIIAYYDHEMGIALQNEKTMIGEFDRALAEEQFQMYLQPQLSADQRLLGAEALVRWIHPQKGMIPPGEFIPLFEKCGYIPRLDSYIWEIACRQLRKWKEQGHDDLHISVNISPKDFYFINIYEAFTGLVEEYGIDPKKLKLEITETALMTEVNQQLNLLEKLRRYGFDIEIDDFGSGYSSLNMLKDIEVDVLKLDMGFLRKTQNEEKGTTIMNAVISMSKQLGLTVLAEGVETVEQVDYLTQAGCDIFQGFYFARPEPVEEFEQKYFK